MSIVAQPSFKIYSEDYTDGMKYEVKESQDRPGDYVAIAVNEASRGETYVALFSGPDAKKRAEEYAAWKNSELEVSGEQLLRR
jgi:hypothetical protein